MIAGSPFAMEGSLWWCLSLSALMSLAVRRAFTHDSIKWGERYRPLMGGLTFYISFLIPFTAFLLAAGILFPGLILKSYTETASLDLFRLLVPLLVFHTILWLLIPLLRKHFHPAFCAVCWTLPNIIYFSYFRSVSLLECLVIIPVKSSLIKAFSLIWLCGFAAVMIYRITSHLRFRKALLAQSTEITEGHVYELYLKLLKEFRCQKTYRLGRTASLHTPLSIGIEESSAVILLPERDYTDEQLDLILRHELVHIQRKDPYIKFFMSVVNAAGWFIPFAWMSCAKAAQDLELSCDQTVICGCDEVRKREYAELILSVAADERGFTTCLAAEAKDLQYRLRGIMKPEKKGYGTVLIFLICFVMLSLCGTISLAQECGTVSEVIMGTEESISDAHITSVVTGGSRRTVKDEPGLTAFIMSEELLRVSHASAVFPDPLAEAEEYTTVYIGIGADQNVILFSGRSCEIWHGDSHYADFFLLRDPFDLKELEPYLD